MEVTLYELLQGNATIIKGKEYLSAKDYVQPFLDAIESLKCDYHITVKVADQISVSDTKNVIYNRVHIQAFLNEESDIQGNAEVLGLIYGLDLRKPMVKVYRGYVNRESKHLMMCNEQLIKYQELKPTEPIDIDPMPLLSYTNDFKSKLYTYQNEFLADHDKYKDLGKWIDFSLSEFHYNGIHSTKLAAPNAVAAYQAIYKDGESDYYCDESQVSSVLNAFEAFAAVIANDKKDIMNTFEKTLLIEKMLSKGVVMIKDEDEIDVNAIDIETL